MLHNTNRRVKEYGRRHRFQSRWWRVLAAMACVVVFCTTYALILPAATLSQDTVCGLEEHTHSDECYAQELICTDESEEHEHSDTCYVSVLTCDLEEHQHSDDCYADDEVSEQSEEAATEAAGESATEAGTADAETGKGSEGSGEGLTEDAEVDGSKDSAKGIEDSGEGLTEGSENSGEGLTENAEIGGTENAAEGLTEDGVVDGEDTENAEETDELTLTEQTVEATVYTDDSYDDLYTENVTITVAGNLPEGVKVKAYPVDLNDEDSEIRFIEAYDITLLVPTVDEETGEETLIKYEPDSAVKVSIVSDKLKDLDSVNVYHIDDADDENPNPQPELVTEDVSVGRDNEIRFDAERFSTYGWGDTSFADVTDNGNGKYTMSVGDTLTVNDHTYVSSYKSGRNTYTSSSSNTNVASLSVRNGTATITAVGTGTSTITIYYEYSYYGWTSHASETLYITVQQGSSSEGTDAALYFLKTPTGDPLNNATGGWVPDSTSDSASQIVAKINVDGATWEDSRDVAGQYSKNIYVDSAKYVVTWPDGTENETGANGTWSISSDNDYFNEILNLVYDEWKSELEEEQGITDLQKSDITGITIIPRKISRNNGGKYDYHVDCSIALVSDRFYKVQFWVKAPNSVEYDLKTSKMFRNTDSVPAPDRTNYSNYTYQYKVGDTRTIDGTVYVMKGWYAENASGGAHSDSTVEFSYTPNSRELGDGVVNFYAEWAPATNNLTIVKYEKGDKTKLLSEAVFKLTNTNDSAKEYTSDETNNDGETTISDIPWGTYTLTETNAPAGYKGIDSNVTVTIGENISISAGATGCEYTEGKLYVPNEPNEIKIYKVDGTNNNSPIVGVLFTLTGPDSFEQKQTTGNDGYATFTKLPDGSYTLQETTPNGYNDLKSVIKFSVNNGVIAQFDKGETDASKGDDGVITVPNYKLAMIQIKKVDASGNVIATGATFTLSASGKDDQVLTTGDDGFATFTMIADGSYTLTETKAPENYVGIEGSVAITITKGVLTVNPGTTGATFDGSTGIITVPNELQKLNFQLKKVDSATGATLPDAEFTLSADGFTSQNVTTDANGLATFTDITAGVYTLTETKAPDGYNILTDTITITVNNGKVTDPNGKTTQDKETGIYTVTVGNTAGTALPNTGGPGTTMYTLSGLMLMAIAAAGCLMYRGRMSGKGGAR